MYLIHLDFLVGVLLLIFASTTHCLKFADKKWAIFCNYWCITFNLHIQPLLGHPSFSITVTIVYGYGHMAFIV